MSERLIACLLLLCPSPQVKRCCFGIFTKATSHRLRNKSHLPQKPLLSRSTRTNFVFVPVIASTDSSSTSNCYTLLKLLAGMILVASTSSFGSVPAYSTSRCQPYLCKDLSLSQVSIRGTFESTSRCFIERRVCECFDLSKELVPYGVAWNWQKDVVREKKALIDMDEECPDTVIILQHHPVYTMGTGSSVQYLNFDMKDAPCEVYRTERGGEVTYHGPGQLVMYPIINLRNQKMDLHWYLRALEEVVMRALSSTFSIKAHRADGLTGVWAGDKKLAAIGIKVSQWVTYHGLALNVFTDLTPFDWIVPCGIRNRKVGSIKQLLGEVQLSNGYENGCPIGDLQLIDSTCKSLIKEFSEVFQLEIHHRTMPVLERKPECSLMGKPLTKTLE